MTTGTKVITGTLLVEVVSIGIMDDGTHGVEVSDIDGNVFAISMQPEDVRGIGKAGLLGRKVRLSVSFPLKEG